MGLDGTGDFPIPSWRAVELNIDYQKINISSDGELPSPIRD
jgi:hypothetical protein